MLAARIRVRTYELDSFGHVNNSVYLNYLEEARSEYLRQMNLSFNDFPSLGVQLVIAEVHIKYLVPARYGDDIEIQGVFRDVRAASLYIDYRLVETVSGRVLATATTKGAFIEASTGKPCRAPETFRQAFLASASTAAPV